LKLFNRNSEKTKEKEEKEERGKTKREASFFYRDKRTKLIQHKKH
jgi:hypothetical protein